MRKKHPFILCSLLLSYFYADAQTLEVNGDVKSFTGIFRALRGTLPNDTLMSYGYNTTVGDYTSLKVAGAAANKAELRLLQNGNVGIGTQNPQAKLEVLGDVKSSTGVFRALTGTLPNDTLMSYGYNTTVGDYTSLKVAGAAANKAELRLLQNGNVGIGTQNPQAKLEVLGDVKSSTGVFRALTGTLPNDILMSHGYNTTVGDYTSLKVAGATANTAELRLVQNGNVGIGTQNPQSRLAVNGTITATRVKVTQSGWADFVFQDGYRLPSLTETEAFIKKNKRLPDMPSEEQVKANGVDVADTQAKLLQKIEELTLHLIELNNKVTAQQQLLAAQSKEIERLKK